MSVTNTAIDLIRSAKRSTLDQFPLYDEDKVRTCFEEMAKLYEENRHDVTCIRPPQDSNSSSTSLSGSENLVHTVLIRHAILERVKRCLLAYHHARLMQIKSIRWLNGAFIPKEILKNMSVYEVRWFSTYCGALASFMTADISDVGGAGGLDLTQSLRPPKSLLLEVRCLKNYGDFETEDGIVLNLKKGSQHLMHRSDCENLIQQGILEHIVDA
nr:DNA replication complex GINS protein PSF1 [Hymenolepis microstoma]